MAVVTLRAAQSGPHRPTDRPHLPDFAARASQGPWGRFVEMVELRLETAAGQKQMTKFQRDALHSPADKAAVFAVQGFGRFGPFGPSKSNSEVRYQLGQDWGLALWWPLVLVGVFQTFQLGRRQLRDGRAAVGVRAADLGAGELGGRGRLHPARLGPLPAADPGTQCAPGRGGCVEALAAMAREGGEGVRRTLIPAAGVFLILLGSDAFFWHSRDWNTASRLMLTYAMVDRGTVAITGLDQQTGDKACVPRPVLLGQAPRLSLAGGRAVRVREAALRLAAPSPRWSRLEVLAGRLLDHAGHVGSAHRLDGRLAGPAGPRARLRRGAAVLVGLAYGLSTPAYVYATLAYGHQASAFALFSSFLLIRKEAPRFAWFPPRPRGLPGGFRVGDRAASGAGIGDPGPLSRDGDSCRGASAPAPWRSLPWVRPSRRWRCWPTTRSRSARHGTWATSIM